MEGLPCESAASRFMVDLAVKASVRGGHFITCIVIAVQSNCRVEYAVRIVPME